MRKVKSRLTPLAKTLRKAGNLAEDRLWLAIRNRNLNGIKFSRQVPIGPYIAAICEGRITGHIVDHYSSSTRRSL